MTALCVNSRAPSPKTHGSRRVVLLPPEVVVELAALRTAEPEGATVMFLTTHGTPYTAETISYLMERVAARAGIPLHLTSHVLRRTTNNLVRQTSGELVARAITGNTTQQMTELYSSVDHEERTSALRGALGGALGGTGATWH